MGPLLEIQIGKRAKNPGFLAIPSTFSQAPPSALGFGLEEEIKTMCVPGLGLMALLRVVLGPHPGVIS